MNELSQLDELIESDILEALGEDKTHSDNEHEEEILIEDVEDEILIEDVDETPNDEEIQKEVNVSGINTSDLASLLSELLNNKTIEITIKIKD